MKRREFILKSTFATSLALTSPQFLMQSFAGQDNSSFASGLIEHTANGQHVDIINSRNLMAGVTPDGNIKLTYPEFKTSFDGNTQCKAWLMDSFMTPMKQAEIAALSSTGLHLPEGNHTFYIYWIDAHVADLKQLLANWWEIMQNPQTYRKHTAPAEYVILEIKNTTSRHSRELKIPPEIRAATWYPQYLETKYEVDLPADKIFGVTKRVAGVPAQAFPDKGLYIQAVYADVNNGLIPYNRTWVCQRIDSKGNAEIPYEGTLAPGQTVTLEANNLNCKPDDIISIYKGYSEKISSEITITYSIPHKSTFRFEISNTSEKDITLQGGKLYAKYYNSVNEEAENFYSGYARKGNLATSQLCESGIPYDDVERIFKRVYELQVERDGVRDVNDTTLIGDYFEDLYGYGDSFSFFVKTYDEKRALMSSPENAKKQKMDGEQSLYYSKGAYKYRHRMVGGYLDGIARLLDGIRIYGHIATLEKQYIAMSDRRVLTFGWVAFEGAQCETERAGIDQRLPLKGGDLIRTSRPEASFEQMKYEAFFSLLIGDYYTLWDDNVIYGTDINNFGLAYIGGAASWKNQWQPSGGKMVQYDPQDPAQPKSSGGKYQWSDSAAPGHNGAFAGAWLLAQIKDRINKSLRYASFNYSTNGINNSGYFDGDEPVQGALGTAEISRFGIANAGQFNIINQQEHRKPIVMVGNGTAGKVAIVLYPFAGLTETVTYKIKHSGTYTIKHTGPVLGVYRL